MIGDFESEDVKKSSYNPSQAVKDLTAELQSDYSYGHQILTKPWPELNDYSVLDDMNNGRMMFNAFVDENSTDPGSDWKWRGTRSMARNKGIAMHAQLTMAYLIPSFVAQNDSDEVDRDMSDFMRDLIDWMADDLNSNYKESFLSMVFAMETDPVVYLGAEFLNVMQTIKEKNEDGTYTPKEIRDEVLSGFKAPIYTADQVLISNAYERDIQKHRRVIKREWIEVDEARAMFGEKEYFDAVVSGYNVVYNADDGLFYEIKDQDHSEFLVEHVTGLNRRGDQEVHFVGGVYVGDDNVDENPMLHRDNFGAPRYDIQDFGYYPIGSHFFYRKSMMNAMRWDNMLYDAMAELVMNRSILEVDAPIAISGTDKIDEDIVFPNAVVTFTDKDTKVTKLLPDSNLQAGFAAMRDTKDSMEDASVSDMASGQLPAASTKAYIAAQAQQNAKKMIIDVAKGMALSISKYGLLMADIAINHLTIPEVDELVGSPLKYKSFLLPKRNVSGKSVAKQLMFDDGLLGAQMTDEQQDEYNLNLLEKVGYPDNTKHIYVANPEVFAKMKYLCTADYEELFPRNEEAMQAMLTALYAQLNADPMIEREALLRELMRSYFKGRGDDFVAKKPMMGMQGLPAEAPGEQSNAAGAQETQRQLSTAGSSARV